MTPPNFNRTVTLVGYSFFRTSQAKFQMWKLNALNFRPQSEIEGARSIGSEYFKHANIVKSVRIQGSSNEAHVNSPRW